MRSYRSLIFYTDWKCAENDHHLFKVEGKRLYTTYKTLSLQICETVFFKIRCFTSKLNRTIIDSIH